MFSRREVIAQRSGNRAGPSSQHREAKSVKRRSPDRPCGGSGSRRFLLYPGGDWMDYKSKRWKSLRARILRRDGYQCRECRRYGKAVQADTVHHVYPAALYPELSWAPWNLVSLCSDCHNAMHDRVDGQLTDAGRAWCRRVSPPSLGCCSASSGDRRGQLFPTEETTGQGVNWTAGKEPHAQDAGESRVRGDRLI